MLMIAVGTVFKAHLSPVNCFPYQSHFSTANLLTPPGFVEDKAIVHHTFSAASLPIFHKPVQKAMH